MKCTDLGKNLNYTVVRTKQCVSSCKGDYKYFFNKKTIVYVHDYVFL